MSDTGEVRDCGRREYVPKLVSREYLRREAERIGEPGDVLILADRNGGGEPDRLGDTQEDRGVPHQRAEGIAAALVSSDNRLVWRFTDGYPQVLWLPPPDV